MYYILNSFYNLTLPEVCGYKDDVVQFMIHSSQLENMLLIFP